MCLTNFIKILFFKNNIVFIKSSDDVQKIKVVSKQSFGIDN